jgi:acyl-CoA reductase-like NAD-dependent aldehyde dehydrogenase
MGSFEFTAHGALDMFHAALMDPVSFCTASVWSIVALAIGLPLAYSLVSWLLSPPIPTIRVEVRTAIAACVQRALRPGPCARISRVDHRSVRAVAACIYSQVKEDELRDVLDPSRATVDPAVPKKGIVQCWDPSSMIGLGELPAMGREEVVARIERSRRAQVTWAKSSFDQRRMLLKTMLKYIVDNQETIARVSARDSGKAKVDAAMGEIMVTCEKLRWTINNAEQYLVPEKRASGTLMPHKRVWVEWVPVGVVGAIVPWNYPFHNVFNPLIAALFSGNGFVVKVSEYSSWSTRYYGRIIEECLKAVGAPVDLVQIVTGFGETGHALVTGGINKLIFVGSPEIGMKVMQAAGTTWHPTPVVLELGGKDPFIVCEDYKVTDDLIQVAVRGVFIHMGQNCAGPERFFIYESIYEDFVQRCAKLINQLELGDPLGSPTVDCGAVVMGDAACRALTPSSRASRASPNRACSRRRRCSGSSTTPSPRARGSWRAATCRPRRPRSGAAPSTRRRCSSTCPRMRLSARRRSSARSCA